MISCSRPPSFSYLYSGILGTVYLIQSFLVFGPGFRFLLN